MCKEVCHLNNQSGMSVYVVPIIETSPAPSAVPPVKPCFSRKPNSDKGSYMTKTKALTRIHWGTKHYIHHGLAKQNNFGLWQKHCKSCEWQKNPENSSQQHVLVVSGKSPFKKDLMSRNTQAILQHANLISKILPCSLYARLTFIWIEKCAMICYFKYYVYM